jgi:Arc/MetJ-type ribon-helix-helix transcriptional regulator
MPQFNLHLTPDFEAAIDELMRLRRIRTKSDAVRLAVIETVAREKRARRVPDFATWVGLGRRVPENPNPRFRTDDDLWS